jgi:hypothetical protein
MNEGGRMLLLLDHASQIGSHALLLPLICEEHEWVSANTTNHDYICDLCSIYLHVEPKTPNAGTEPIAAWSFTYQLPTETNPHFFCIFLLHPLNEQSTIDIVYTWHAYTISTSGASCARRSSLCQNWSTRTVSGWGSPHKRETRLVCRCQLTPKKYC